MDWIIFQITSQKSGPSSSSSQQRQDVSKKSFAVLPTLDDECDDMFTNDAEKFSTASLTAGNVGNQVAKKQLDLLDSNRK